MNQRIIAGAQAEASAASYLSAQGWHITTRNFRSRFGEIDIIAELDDNLAFVEVRYRQNTRFGQPYETVDVRKQEKLIKTAMIFLQQHPKLVKKACRFDIISMTREHKSIEWIQHAFELTPA